MVWHSRVILRGIVALAAGAIVAVVLMPLLGTAAGLLGGWTITALAGSVWSLLAVWRMDAAQTRAHATAEDPGRRATRVISVFGSIISIAAVIVVLTQTHQSHGVKAFVLAGIALASVAASWLLIQTSYLLRLADVYYTEPVGGIVFNQDEDPAYPDFAYVAFGVGLTYQVADTNVTSSTVRRVIMAQSLLGFMFTAIILGAVINLIAGL